MIKFNMRKPDHAYDGNSVGVTGENNAHTQEFFIKGISNEEMVFALHLRFADGSVNSVCPDEVSCEPEGTRIFWSVRKNDIFCHGFFELQIQGSVGDELIFQTEIVRMFADESLCVEDKAYENPNSLTLRLRDENIELLRKTAEQQRLINKNAYIIANSDWGKFRDDITRLQNGGYFANPTQIASYINEWLTLHPEATTTVLNQSIGREKLTDLLIDELKLVNDDMYVYAPDLGGAVGDCTVIKNGDNIIICDCSGEAGTLKVIEFLKTLKKSGDEKLKITAFIVSHYHSDHVGYAGDNHYGLETVVNCEDFDFSRCTFYLPNKLPGEMCTRIEDGSAYQGMSIDQYTAREAEIWEFLEENSYRIYDPSPGFHDKIQIGDLKIRFLNIDTDKWTEYYGDTLDSGRTKDYKFSRLNNFSLCTEITHGSNVLFLAGDIEPAAQKVVAEELGASPNIVKVEHHGLNSGTDSAYDTMISPRIAFAEGYPKQAKTDKKRMVRLREKGAQIAVNPAVVYSNGTMAVLMSDSLVWGFQGESPFSPEAISNVSLDDIKTPGFYVTGVRQAGIAEESMPEELRTPNPHRRLFLEVFQTHTSGERYVQRLTSVDETVDTWERAFIMFDRGGREAWTDWEKFVKLSELKNSYAADSLETYESLDEVTEPGFYSAENSQITSAITGKPDDTVTKLFVLEVFKTSTSGNRFMQRLTYTDGYGETWGRCFIKRNEGEEWTSWVKYAKSSEVKNEHVAETLENYTTLNDLKTPGFYAVTTGTIARQLTDKPDDTITKLFIVEVFKTNPNGERYLQRLTYTDGHGETWTRCFIKKADGDGWTDWVKAVNAA